MQAASQVELPPGLGEQFEIYVNGVPKRRGVDYDLDGSTVLFREELRSEGRLGFWRWFSLFLGVAGTYRRNDKVDVVYDAGGVRRVVTLTPAPAEPAPPPPAR